MIPVPFQPTLLSLTKKMRCGLVFAWAMACLVSSAADAASLQRIATGLSAPLFATHVPGDAKRLFVLEKNSGLVKIIHLAENQLAPNPFLTVNDISTNGERGLLGLAFHPNYAQNKELFVSVTNSAGDSELRRYFGTNNQDRADSSSYEVLITVPQFASNHNGGWIGFGPQGYLYYALGDGGGGNDPQNNGQDTSTLLGSILRLDVNRDDFPSDPDRNYGIPAANPFVGGGPSGLAREEIWAFGLRNPWRASFDRSTGDLWVGDVGQGAREEVNFQASSSAGGENYGWRLREGKIANPAMGVGGPRPANNVDPVYDYTRGSGPFQGRSVTGGYVYRGPVLALRGKYFFADFASGRFWSLQISGEAVTELIDWTPQLLADVGTVGNISSFGEDARANLYLIDFDGDVFKFVGEVADATSTLPAVHFLLEEEPD